MVGDGDIDKPPHIFHHKTACCACISRLFPLVSCNHEWTELKQTKRDKREGKETKQTVIGTKATSLSLSPPNISLLLRAAFGWAVIGSGSSTGSHTHIQESGLPSFSAKKLIKQQDRHTRNFLEIKTIRKVIYFAPSMNSH